MELQKENIGDPPSNPFKKVGEVLYSLESEYIFGIATSIDNVAVSGSTHHIKLYNGAELKHIMSLTGHTGAISKIEFDPGHPSIIYSSSQDGSVRCWDIRSSQPFVKSWQLPSNHEAMTHACSHSAHLLAVGSNLVNVDAFIHFFDMRSSPLMASFSESMSDDVTQLQFHPMLPRRLLSGSADGIACIFDLDQWDEYEDLTDSIPAGASISKLGWYGASDDQVWLTTHSEVFSVWTSEGDLLKNFGDIRQNSLNISPMDYLITGLVCPQTGDLYVTAGSNCGDITVLEVDYGSLVPLHASTNAHNDIVRDAAMDWARKILYTGGEDAKLIAWAPYDFQTPSVEPQTKRKTSSFVSFDKSKDPHSPYPRAL